MSTGELPAAQPRVLLLGPLDAELAGLLAALARWRDPAVTHVSSLGLLAHSEAPQRWDAVVYAYDPSSPTALADLRSLVGAVRASPVILLAGAIGEHAVAAGLRAGATDYASLDDPDDLLGALDRCLADAAPGERLVTRGEMAQAVRGAETRFLGAFADAPIGMALIAPNGEFLRVNQALCQLTGYRAEDLIGSHYQLLSHPDDVGIEVPYMQRLVNGAADSFQIQKRYYHRRGPTLWVNIAVSIARDASGAPLHFTAQVMDITAAKEAEAKLRDAHARNQAILENVPAWFSVRSLDGRYLEVNNVLAEVYGVTKEELIGRYPTDFIQTQVTADVAADDMAVWETGEPVTREIEISHPDGSRRTYHAVRYPVFDESGEITAVGSFALDITDRKLADLERDRALEAMEEAQEIARIGSWRWDAVTNTIGWSRELNRIFDREPQAPAPSPSAFFQYVLREDRRSVATSFRGLLSGEPMFELEFRILTDRGAERWLHMVAHADQGHPGIYAGTIQDVTATRAVQRDVQIARERFRRAFEDAPVGMAISDTEGNFIQVNDSFCEMTGYTREQLIGTNVNAISHPDDVEERNQLLRQLLEGELTRYHREGRLIRSSGEPIWVSRSVSALRGPDGRAEQILAHMVDVTERMRMEHELRHLADHDPLTGLLNRRGLEAELERHVTHVNRYGSHGALLVLDLDHFKTVNDTLGHEAGDRLIVEVAHRLRGRLRQSDSIARLGGDEFAILLPDSTPEEAELVANEIVDDIQQRAFVTGRQVRRRVTASVGVALFPQGLLNGEEALVNADLAMYDAKEAGRGRVAVHRAERDDEPRMKTRLTWIQRIRSALDEGRFTLYGQPIMALHSGTVNQYELLLRMLDDDGDVIPPSAFLYIAERYDLIQELDEWVFREAVRLLEAEGKGHEDSLEINVSGKSLGSQHFIETIESELRRSQIDPGRLIFEITETAAITNIALARTFAERMQGLGCRFALDDFGAGFGSFFYLKHISFDYLKIDGEFVSGCLHNRTDQLVIESLVAIARGLNKQTIAEYVEDRATELFLRHTGVDLAQGYHIGRPVSLAEGVPAWDVETRQMRL
ncbi:MAG TPA: PAS domain S-box protein [Solirubrobacteraceae bacterium]|nr:PAS domain S-box protein [Solirubrobacteraceae bacterium]